MDLPDPPCNDHRHRCQIARTPEERAAAEELLVSVYGSRLGLPPAACSQEPGGSQRVVLLTWSGSDPVATLTLQSPAFSPGEGRQPLELERIYRLDDLGLKTAEVAEVRRIASLPDQSAAVDLTFKAAIWLSAHCGIRHWVGLAEARGDRRLDAALVQILLEAHGLTDLPPRMRSVEADPLFDRLPEPRTPVVDREHLRRFVALPHRVAYFARRMNARAVGAPMLHPHYSRLVVPMLASVQTIRQALHAERKSA